MFNQGPFLTFAWGQHFFDLKIPLTVRCSA